MRWIIVSTTLSGLVPGRRLVAVSDIARGGIDIEPHPLLEEIGLGAEFEPAGELEPRPYGGGEAFGEGTLGFQRSRSI